MDKTHTQIATSCAEEICHLLGVGHPNDIAHFIENAIEQNVSTTQQVMHHLKVIASDWTEEDAQAIKRHEHSGTEAFEDMAWVEANTKFMLCEHAKHALHLINKAQPQVKA
jgi:hypothetical protein